MYSEVTVLIPSFNPGGYLRYAVKSVFKQSYKNWKLLIVDDASTDNSLLTINDFLNDPRVRVIKNSVNMGQSKTQNNALQFVETPFILMLDSDDWLFPNTLKLLIKESRNISEDVALICGKKRTIYEENNGEIYYKITDNYGRSFDDKYEYLLSNYVPYPRFYRTSALRFVGGWPTDDPYEGRYLEDQRIIHRLIEHFKIHWINVELYNYRRHLNNMSNNLKLMNEMKIWLVNDSLKRWGNHYDPVFEYYNGWLLLKELLPKK
jgi:glycosyltransferase involved in cell wall biosynthesis